MSMQRSRNVLEVHLSAEAMNTLNELAEIYHATPERMAKNWIESEVERTSRDMPANAKPSGRGARGSADRR